MNSPDDKFTITRETMDNFNEWIVEAGRRKKILLDLIAELRDAPNPYTHADERWTDVSHDQYDAMMNDPVVSMCDWVSVLADSAEAKLKEA